MNCSRCGREVPADAIYCPYCTGAGKTTDGEVIRGGIRGGLVGLLVGLVTALLLLYVFGAERGIKGIAFIVPGVTFTTGLIFGLVKAKREWK